MLKCLSPPSPAHFAAVCPWKQVRVEELEARLEEESKARQDAEARAEDRGVREREDQRLLASLRQEVGRLRVGDGVEIGVKDPRAHSPAARKP